MRYRILSDWIEYQFIRRSGLFDPVFYLLYSPDVRRADIDPLMHYIKHGWKEGRDPSRSFSTSFYLDKYPDVRSAKINPLLPEIKMFIVTFLG